MSFRHLYHRQMFAQIIEGRRETREIKTNRKRAKEGRRLKTES